ncbi:taurine ABC transporter substrate-binding protein [Anaerosporobacter sp.]
MKDKKIIGIILILIVALQCMGCGKKDSEKTLPDVVNIGTMNLVNADLIARQEAYYEEILGTKVNIVQFDSGRDVNTAFVSGSIDISELGSSPTALGIANKLDYEVFWIGDIIGKAESLVAKKDSSINNISDLKGKKIATPFASTSHYSLLNALKLAGIKESEVTIVDLQPNDIYAAWERGDIDAAYVWYPVLGQLIEDGVVITDSEQLAQEGVITADLNVVNKKFAEKYPEVVTNYVKAQIKATDLYYNDEEKAVNDIATILGIAKEEAKEQASQVKWLTAKEQLSEEYLKGQMAKTLKSTADFLVEQKSIESAPDLSVYEEAITTEFIENALNSQ